MFKCLIIFPTACRLANIYPVSCLIACTLKRMHIIHRSQENIPNDNIPPVSQLEVSFSSCLKDIKQGVAPLLFFFLFYYSSIFNLFNRANTIAYNLGESRIPASTTLSSSKRRLSLYHQDFHSTAASKINRHSDAPCPATNKNVHVITAS